MVRQIGNKIRLQMLIPADSTIYSLGGCMPRRDDLPDDAGQPDFHVPDSPLAMPELEPGQVLTRTVPHPDELAPRGIRITCACCGATRDWLLVNVGSDVYIRCRCTHEWLERDLDLEAFDGLFTYVERLWGTYDDAVTGLGYDGTFAGTYWD
jgi:hypothetical protein